jgi:cell division protein FtsZ
MAKKKKTIKRRRVLAKKAKKLPPKKEPAKDDLRLKKTKIKVIGVGDGAAAIICELAKELKRVDFLIANTDWRSLKKLPRQVKVFNFGEKYTHGLGTGMDPEIGRQAAIAEKEKLEKFLKGTDLCLIVACLGGGTGSGAAPVIARLLKKQGILSFGIFTLPFRFEGEKKAETARDTLEKIKSELNAVLVFPNEKIFQTMDKNLTFGEGFLAVNRVLAKGLEGLLGLIFQPGLINIDFADLKTILEGRGKAAFLANSEFTRGIKAEELKKKLFQSQFLNYNFRHAKAVLFNIVSDPLISLNEVSEISQMIFANIHPEAKIIFGVSFDKKLLGIARVAILAIGGREKGLGQPKKPKSPPSLKLRRASKNKGQSDSSTKNEVKIRRNALQIKEEARAQEETIAAKERFWEKPAILRRQFS